MAQKVTVQLVDDLDGSEATETVAFGLDGQHFEIDLSDGNAAELRTTLAAYQAAARTISGTKFKVQQPAPKKRRKANGKKVNTPSAREVRQWAQSQGLEVSPKGRVPRTLVEQYQAQ